jgi:hypothetical protein
MPNMRAAALAKLWRFSTASGPALMHCDAADGAVAQSDAPKTVGVATDEPSVLEYDASTWPHAATRTTPKIELVAANQFDQQPPTFGSRLILARKPLCTCHTPKLRYVFGPQ